TFNNFKIINFIITWGISFVFILKVNAEPPGEQPIKLTLSIEEVREQLIEKNRETAARILNEMIDKAKSTSEKQKLIKELHMASSLFFSNEGQKLFELAESIRFSGQQGYQNKYEEALKKEGSNWSVLAGQVLGFLSVKKCKAAVDSIKKAEEIDSYRIENRLMRFASQICEGTKTDSETSSDLKIEEEQLSKETKSVYKTLVAQIDYLYGKLLGAQKFIQEVEDLDASYPTPYFLSWDWTSNEATSDIRLEKAQKYLNLCKSVTFEIRKKYYWDAELCSKTEVVEDFIKKSENINQ
ncbi:MAG: hypothetical protein ABL927_02445, partial [Bdellovibrionales bacterium]